MQNLPLPSCPRCGHVLPENAPHALCPKCLLAAVAEPTGATVLGSSPLKPPPPAVSEVAAAFPQWEVLELLGQGGMGAVYKVRQPSLDRLVALKVLPASLAEIPGFSERFAREAKLLARLNHPGIVTVHEFGQSGPFFYLLMEYVEGVNLRQAMQAGKFSSPQALSVVQRICEALQFAHEEGVVHRDIKPENILLDAKGRVKLADFGIGKLAGEMTRTAPNLTVSGAALGTPQYMAPEQIERPQDVDHRADIYSLGVVLYELLTGELPLGRFAAPSEKTDVHRGVDAVVLRALEKERERRQQSAAEMKTQVELAEQGRHLPAPGKRSRKHVLAVVLFALSVLSFVASMLLAKHAQFASITAMEAMNQKSELLGRSNDKVRQLNNELQEAKSRKSGEVSVADLTVKLMAAAQAAQEAEASFVGAKQDYAEASGPPPSWFLVLSCIALFLVPATLLGWMSLAELRHRHQEEGRFAAMFTAWFLPMASLNGGAVLGLVVLLDSSSSLRDRPDAQGPLIALVVNLLLMLDFWMLRTSWRWLTRNEKPASLAVLRVFATGGIVSLILLAVTLYHLREAASSKVAALQQPAANANLQARTYAEFKVEGVHTNDSPGKPEALDITAEIHAFVPLGQQFEPYFEDTSGLVAAVETGAADRPWVTMKSLVVTRIRNSFEEEQRIQVTWTLGKSYAPLRAGSLEGRFAAFGHKIGIPPSGGMEAEILQRGKATSLNTFEKKVVWSGGVNGAELKPLKENVAPEATMVRKGELTFGLQLRPTPKLK